MNTTWICDKLNLHQRCSLEDRSSLHSYSRLVYVLYKNICFLSYSTETCQNSDKIGKKNCKDTENGNVFQTNKGIICFVPEKALIICVKSWPLLEFSLESNCAICCLIIRIPVFGKLFSAPTSNSMLLLIITFPD